MRYIIPSLLFLLFFNFCGTIIQPGHVGLLWEPRGQGLSKKPYLAGYHSHNNWRSEMIIYPIQWDSHKEKVDVITRDDLHIDVVASIVIRPIVDKIYNLHTEIGQNYYEEFVKPEFRTSIRNVITDYPMIQISKKTPEIEKKIAQLISSKIKDKYLEADDVIIDDINFSTKILNAIEEKLTKEQQLEAMKFELNIAQKDNEIARMKAKREAEITVIKAEAKAKALQIVNSQLTKKYIQFKAFESPNSKIIYFPIDKSGLPLITDFDKTPSKSDNKKESE